MNNYIRFKIVTICLYYKEVASTLLFVDNTPYLQWQGKALLYQRSLKPWTHVSPTLKLWRTNVKAKQYPLCSMMPKIILQF